MGKVYLVTGVTGFVGQEILSFLITDPQVSVHCLIRGAKDEGPGARLQKILGALGLQDHQRIHALDGDLKKPRLGLEPGDYGRLTREVTNIIHVAADVKFNRTIEKIREINVEGVRQILDLAQDCLANNPHFSHLDHVSTAFVAGLDSGLSREDRLYNERGFKNSYEQSKFEAEQLVCERMDRVPAIIFRPSIVLGVSETGLARPNNVIYPMLKIFNNWSWPVVPALARTTIDIVPVDFVARALLHISADPQNFGQRFHLAAGPQGAMSLASFVRVMKAVFGKRVFLIHPLIYRGIVRPAVRLFKPGFFAKSTAIFTAFTPYIWRMNPTFSVDNTTRALQGSGIATPRTAPFLETCFRYAIKSDFGQKPVE